MNCRRHSFAADSLSRCALALLALTAAPACATDPAASDANSRLTDGAAGADGEGGGLPTCPATNLGFFIQTDPLPTGSCETCGSGVVGLDARGVIASASPGRFILDRCSPGAACTEPGVEFEVQAYGYDQTLPAGAYVEVRFQELATEHHGSSYTLSVRNLPEWEGATNPVSTWDGWYLVLSDGLGMPPGAPFTLTSRAFDCSGFAGALSVDYRVAFGDADGGASVELGEGDSATVLLAGQEWRIRLLRSSWRDRSVFYSGPHAWWALGAPP